jgi:hypothetical protein
MRVASRTRLVAEAHHVPWTRHKTVVPEKQPIHRTLRRIAGDAPVTEMPDKLHAAISGLRHLTRPEVHCERNQARLRIR